MSSSTQQLTRLAAAWCLAWPALAQVVPPTTLATPTPATNPATIPTTAPAAGTTASAPTAGPAPASPANAADCARLTDEAMAADLALANAQSSDKQDPQQLASQVDKAMALWTQAGQACTGRAQERALRNLRDNQRLRDNLRPQLDAAPACTRSQHDATQLQDMAQQALRERRWLDAAMLYRKAENSWDLATERCTGKLQQQAQLKRSQTAEDAHNAEFCAPAFEKARDYTRQFRQTSASLSAIDKQTQSLAAETLWRNAEGQCIGNAQTLARSNGQNLNKERGTPWIATQPPVVASNAATAGGAGTASSASTPAAVGSATAASAATPGAATGATTPTATDSGGSTEASKAALPWKDVNVTVSGTHYQGRFQQSGSKISGSGEVKWANGDRYQGELQDTQPHGQGEFTWANGQRYQGQWVKGVPQGSGQLAFANGNQYQGEVVNGVPQGRGTLRYASGDSFEGLFEQGQPAGSGIYRWASGQSYEGPWRNGQPEGQGTLRFVNGNQYQGQLVAGQPEGEGRMTYAWGDRYQGGFAAGVPHGSGRYDWKNGDHYEGQWQHGKKHGQGSMTWANGDHWQGRFEQDQQTADGVLTRAPGETPSPGPQAATTKPQATPQAGTATPAP